jgi:hypothetical protein
VRAGRGGRESDALEALLVDLGPQIQRGVDAALEAADAPRFCPTGIPALDLRLGGGFPVGRLGEICGPPSSGRTALALALLAETLARGVLAAWIDLADAFDPASAALSEGDLERLLWVRARDADQALRSAERLLRTEGFELIVLDAALYRPRPEARPKSRSRPPAATAAIRDVAWLRLARLAASTRTTLVALSNASSTGSRAELVIEMQAGAARFGERPHLLDGIETRAVLQRHRSRPTGQAVALRIGMEPGDPATGDGQDPPGLRPDAGPEDLPDLRPDAGDRDPPSDLRPDATRSPRARRR